jgi:hypothetical protein
VAQKGRRMDNNTLENGEVQNNSSEPEPTLNEMMTKVDELLTKVENPEVNYEELVTKQNTVIDRLQVRIKELEDANLKLATMQSAPEKNMTAEEIMLKEFVKE